MDVNYKQLVDAINDSLSFCCQLETTIGKDGELLKNLQKRFQEATAPWFDQSWICYRSRTKPRGRPGDYELIGAIYDGTSKSLGIGGYIDLYIVNLLLAKSVRTRLQDMRTFLTEELAQRQGDVMILNVACGPCREYVGGISSLDNCNIHVLCLDNDQQALDFVEQNVSKTLNGFSEFRCTCYNALRMQSAQATVRKFGRSDIIYSIGLFDYIPDKTLIGILEGWRDSLNEGGVLYVTFKDCNRYDKTPYQWLLDWYFLQRTEEDCFKLFKKAGFDMETLKMTRDSTGVIMNFITRI